MRVGVTDDDARRVDALLGEDPQLCEADGDWTPWVVIAMPVRTDAPRRGAMHALLERADPGLVGADLADDPGPDAGSAHAIANSLTISPPGRRRNGGRSAASAG